MNEAESKAKTVGLRQTGTLSCGELAECPGVPSNERLRRGPVAVIECYEEIPCNPCESNCPRGAICVGDAITNRPCLDAGACIGCAICIARCPGLAIFVVDRSQEDGDYVSLPYELLPLPKVGDEMSGIDRSGEPICVVEVVTVNTRSANDRTAVVTVRVPKSRGMDVRFLRPEGEAGNAF